MSKRTSIVSGVVGGFCLVALALTLAAGPEAQPQPGRFHIVINEHHALVLDTATGKVWEQYLSTNSGNTSPGFNDEKLSAKP
jgi:hypothetical protein